jgi:hypothetical protein
VILTTSALLLFAATLTAWFVAAGARPGARLQIRFAGVLLAALALAGMSSAALAPVVAAIVLPIALTVLALAATTGLVAPPSVGNASLGLLLASLGGLGAAISGWLAAALVPSAFALVVLVVLFARHAAGLGAVQGILSAFCLLAAAAAFALEGADFGLMLFLAAGLLGVSLALSRSNLAAEKAPLRRSLSGIRRGAAR